MQLSVKGRALVEEFKRFALKGSVIDMAVGVIIGSAFSKIVSSLVDDVLMPLLSLVLGTVDIHSLSLTLREASEGEEAVVLSYGAFLQTVFDFFLIALSIFAALKVVMKLRLTLALSEDKLIGADKAKEEDKKAAPPLTKDQELLTEIRDLLKQNRQEASPKLKPQA